MENKPFNDHSFAEFIKQQKLMGSRCENCKTLYCPPRAFCPECHSTKMSWYQFKGRGELKAFTSISVCAPQMIALGYGRDNPYCVGVIKLNEGPRLDARLVGIDARQPETIRIGSPMVVKYLEAESGNSTTALGFHPV